MNSFISDVKDFHVKFGIDYDGPARILPKELQKFRIEFLKEELAEYCKASDEDNLEGMLDALVDLVYVVFGTSLMHGFDFEEAWNRVHSANMKKIRVNNKNESKRNSSFDVVKPEGWKHASLKDLVSGNYSVSKPNWDKYFLGFLPAIAQRATCNRGRNSAIIVDNEQQVVSTGYTGAPPGLPECDEVGHLIVTINNGDNFTQHCIRSSHAEMNAIAQAAKRGVSTKGCILYTKMVPCFDCAKLIVTAKIKRVVCLYDYKNGQNSKELFNKSNIALDIFNEGAYLYA